MPQLDPRTGIEVRAANEPKIAMSVLKQRYAVARATQTRPQRMSRAEAAVAARLAGEINDRNREVAKAGSIRAQLIGQLGPVAGNVRADARIILVATIFAGFTSLPLLVLSVIAAYDANKPTIFMPYAALAVCLAALAVLGRGKAARSTSLAAEFLAVPLDAVPKMWLVTP
ncbi:MAG: hypothetical protein WBX27_15905, partial [Specibacter sp.]